MMNKVITFFRAPNRIKAFTIWTGFSVGLLCSVLSTTSLCADACSDAHKFTFLGVPLAFFGIGIFAAYGATAWLYLKKKRFGHFFPKLISIACGGEVVLLSIQKFIIGHWCPLCNVIAGAVLTVGGFLLCEWLWSTARGIAIRRICRIDELFSITKRALITAVMLMIGLFGSFIGVQGPEHTRSVADPGPSPVRPRPIDYIGKQDSSVEIYIVTDWFCPACKRVEKSIEDNIPQLLGEAKVAFIDLPVHEQSLNYIPYHLSLLSGDKDKYLEGRSVLVRLAETKESPSLGEVQQAMGERGIQLKSMSLNNVQSGIRSFRQVAEDLGVNATPTVVVRNAALKKKAMLVGGNQVNMQNIRKAIRNVSQS